MSLQLFKISSVELTSPQSVIDFNSIPSGYSDLLLKMSSRSTGTNGTCYIYFNSDTTNTNYYAKRLSSYGSGGTGYGGWAAPYFMYSGLSNSTSNMFSNSDLYLPDYTQSKYKTILSESSDATNSGTSNSHITCGIWNSTSSVSSIRIQQVIDSGFTVGSTFTLYGVL